MKRSALALLLLAVLTACSSGSSKSLSPPGPSGAKGSGASAAQVKLADLSPCPTSSTTAVRGGLPDVTLECVGEGPAVHLAGLVGKPTVVNIWGSWCIPCQSEMPFLSSVYDAVKGKVRFLGVDSEDTANSALNFDAHVKPRVRYPSVFDPDRKTLLAVAFAGVPDTLFVDAAGKVVYKKAGQFTSAADLRADLAKYLHVA